GLQYFDMNKAIDERPTYVVFNGAVGSLVGDNALTAGVGERVRLFIGNGGPNLVSSFHVIGEIFDTVYQEGGDHPSHNVQTTLIPAGGAAIVEFKVEVPGTYVLVDHSIFRAFNKGALGMLKVDGPEDQIVYSGKEVDAVYLGKAAEGGDSEQRVAELRAEMDEEIKGNPRIATLTKEIQIAKGKGVYMQTCFVCHQMNGEGVPAQIPPLAKSDFLAQLTDEEAIHNVLAGRTGEVVVNGKKYNGTMTPLNYLSDDQIANVLTYVRNSFGNEGSPISPAQVRKVRATTAPPEANPFE
ncbi:MAG: c-type cytochrome, partial [Verrucomicrobia bacterium]|nr:c-type cytochrome [Verrucomicrobiota bacterium]